MKILNSNILQLTIAEATKRISRAIELRTKEVDPAVYQAVEQVRLYKKKRRSDGEIILYSQLKNTCSEIKLLKNTTRKTICTLRTEISGTKKLILLDMDHLKVH